jgi:hypothetical protein
MITLGSTVEGQGGGTFHLSSMAVAPTPSREQTRAGDD